MNPVSLVTEFHDKFGVSYPKEPTFTPEVCALRIGLLAEEKDELYMAVLTGNRLEQLDALCDLQYVLSGAILHTGLTELVGNEFKWPSIKFPQRTEDVSARVILFSIKIKLLSYQFGASNIPGSVNSLRDMQSILYKLIAGCGFYSVFDDAFQAVHDNNMDKMWTAEECLAIVDKEINASLCDWDKMRYIVRNSLGKIIKPISHKKVDLTPFVK